MIHWIPIKERLPLASEARAGLVWVWHRKYEEMLIPASNLLDNPQAYVAWRQVEAPEPYVEPRRFVVWDDAGRGYVVRDLKTNWTQAYNIPTREAADKIADIYEEAYR